MDYCPAEAFFKKTKSLNHFHDIFALKYNKII